MSTLEQAALRPLTKSQSRALALMEVDVYQRRKLPRAVHATDGAPAEFSSGGWSEADCASPLACAVARAAGMPDAHAWSAAWLQSGLLLPDLGELRARPAAKRALWQQLRARR
jgi:hypothetical protein